MTLELKTRIDLEDLTRGCTFFGTGGGGTPEIGLKMLYPHIDAGKTIEISDPAIVKDDDWVVLKTNLHASQSGKSPVSKQVRIV